jgi:hypothetical protein
MQVFYADITVFPKAFQATTLQHFIQFSVVIQFGFRAGFFSGSQRSLLRLVGLLESPRAFY